MSFLKIEYYVFCHRVMFRYDCLRHLFSENAPEKFWGKKMKQVIDEWAKSNGKNEDQYVMEKVEKYFSDESLLPDEKTFKKELIKRANEVGIKDIKID